MFQAFPLGDKSSVNLRGEYHTENVTTYEKDISTTSDTVEPMDVVTEVPAIRSKEEPVAESVTAAREQAKAAKRAQEIEQENASFYPVFWRLQNDFSEPTRLFRDENFSPFKEDLENTLIKFKKTPVVVQTKNAGDSQRGVKRKHDEDPSDHYANNYNPKYLTSRDLFALEVSSRMTNYRL